MRAFAATLLTALLVCPAAADETVLVHHGDVLRTTLPEDGVARLELDGLRGTLLTVKARARTTGLRPELILLDPSGTEIRRATGRDPARFKRYELPETGRYRVLVSADGGTAGRVDVKVRAIHPERIRVEGAIDSPEMPAHAAFPAFAGTIARFKVKGRDGFQPSMDAVLRPEASTVLLENVRANGPVRRHDGFECEFFGNHRLRIAGEEGSIGRFKAKITLTHPVLEGRDLEIAGSPPGSPGTPALPVIPVPPPPPGDPWALIASGATGTFRVTLEILGDPPYPENPKIRLRSDPPGFRITLQNISGATAWVQWSGGPHTCVFFTSSESDWRSSWPPGPPAQGPPVPYAPGQKQTSTVWLPYNFLTYAPDGTVEATVGYTSIDPRLPRNVTVRFLVR